MLLAGYLVPRSFRQRVEETIQSENIGEVIHKYWGLLNDKQHFAVIISKDEARNVGMCFNVRKIVEKKNGPLNISLEGFLTLKEASEHCTEMLMILRRQARERSNSKLKIRSRTLERNSEDGFLRSSENFVRRSLRGMRDMIRRSSSKTNSYVETLTDKEEEIPNTNILYPVLSDVQEKPTPPKRASVLLRNKKK